MWRKHAVCVGCGAFKRRPAQRCKHCGYEPGSDYEVARAVILARQVQIGTTVVGRPAAELARIAADIRRGRPYLFDPNEEQTTLSAYREQQQAAAARRRKWKIAGALAGAVLILTAAYLLLAT